jgi:hypothetical protein
VQLREKQQNDPGNCQLEMTMRGSHPHLLLIILASLVCAAVGCDKGPAMYKVSGKVLYKDGSVPHAGVCVVNFTPTAGSAGEVHKAASGGIQPDGSFNLFTRVAGDGVLKGEYAATFTIWPGPMEPKSLVLPIYINPKTTPYKVMVDHNIDDLKFEIEPQPGASAGNSGR